MIRKLTSLLFALLLSILSTSAVFAASYPSPPSATEDAAASSGGQLSPMGAVIKVGNDTALAADGDHSNVTCNDVGNLKVQVEPTRKATYMATCAAVARAASATDMARVPGSASKTIKVQKIYATYSTANSTLGINNFYLIKRSTAGSGGTSSTNAGVALDSGSAAASSAGLIDYTANPTTGTAVGTLKIVPIVTPLAVSTFMPNPSGGTGLEFCLFDADKYGQPIVLRGTAENICITNNGATLTGTSPICGFTVVWTEESSIGFLIIYLGRLFLLIRKRKPLTLNNVVNLFGAERKVA